jgi:hypothetical protein
MDRRVVQMFFGVGCEWQAKGRQKGLTEERQDVVVNKWGYTVFCRISWKFILPVGWLRR